MKSKFRLPLPGAAVVALSAVLLSGCSPDEGSVVGLTVDEAGDVLAVVAVCEGDSEGLLLRQGNRDLGRWTLPPVDAGLTMVNLSTDASRVAEPVLGRARALGTEGAERVLVHASSDDYAWGASVELTPEEIDTAMEGEVMWRSETLERTPRESFAEAACDWLGR